MSVAEVRALVGAIADSAPVSSAALLADQIQANAASLDTLTRGSGREDVRAAVDELLAAAVLVRDAGVAFAEMSELCRSWAANG